MGWGVVSTLLRFDPRTSIQSKNHHFFSFFKVPLFACLQGANERCTAPVPVLLQAGGRWEQNQVTFWKGRAATAHFQPSSHFSTAKRRCSLEEYSFSLNTLAQAGGFYLCCKGRSSNKSCSQIQAGAVAKGSSTKKPPEGGGWGVLCW